jgi:hypothetical protein
MRETTSTLIVTPYQAAHPIREIAYPAKEQEGISSTTTETSAQETHYDNPNGEGSQTVRIKNKVDDSTTAVQTLTSHAGSVRPPCPAAMTEPARVTRMAAMGFAMARNFESADS